MGTGCSRTQQPSTTAPRASAYPKRKVRPRSVATDRCQTCTNAHRMELPSRVIRDYAAVSTQNSTYRKYMEDECAAIPTYKAFRNDPATSSFFGVFDGHGGDFCAKYAASHLHVQLSIAMRKMYACKIKEAEFALESSCDSDRTSCSSTEASDGDYGPLTSEEIEECYAQAFAAVDKQLATHEESAASGSTAVTCLLRQFNGKTTYHIANVGDSRAILFSNGKTERVSVDHKATNEDEAQRIRNSNGIIFNKRVGGMLSITRALGQAEEKEFIISHPHVVSGEIAAENSFLLLVSDGVTDVFEDDEMTHYVFKRLARGDKSIAICKSLLDAAKTRGSMDNMTAVLLCFSDVYTKV